MRKIQLIILLFIVCNFTIAFGNDVVIHTNTGNGYDQIYIEPPYVTYDDNLNELYVYFGTTSSIDLCIPFVANKNNNKCEFDENN